MAKKTTAKAEAKAVEPVVEPVAEHVIKLTTCAQCGYPADCSRAGKCVKGFK